MQVVRTRQRMQGHYSISQGLEQRHRPHGVVRARASRDGVGARRHPLLPCTQEAQTDEQTMQG